MPRLMNDDDELYTGSVTGLTRFKFTGAKPERLGASTYTLATVVIDVSVSVRTWLAQLREMLKTIHAALSLSPARHNILLRVVALSDDVTEVHGFLPLDDIDTTLYDAIQIQGSTALFDAIASSFGAMVDYGKVLYDQAYTVSGMIFVGTDGDNNRGTSTAKMVADMVQKAKQSEMLGKCQSLLIGVNAQSYAQYLADLQRDVGIDAFLDIADATPKSIAKLADIISKSASSGTIVTNDPNPSGSAPITF